MNANNVRPGNLKLIQGGLYPQTTLGSVRIVAAPESSPPFKIKAMVFEEAELRKVKSIGLPLLGTKHGRLGKNRCVSLLAGVLKQTTFEYLGQLWLIVPPESSTEIIRLLETELVSE